MFTAEGFSCRIEIKSKPPAPGFDLRETALPRDADNEEKKDGRCGKSMEAKRLLLPTAAVLALETAAADGLLKLKNGDAALLYLCLLRHRGDAASAGRRLGFDTARTEAAAGALYGAGLLTAAPEPGMPQTPQKPVYEDSEILQAIQDSASDFRGLCEATERLLGRMLSPADDRILYGLYDYLALPPEVITLLVAHCVEERRGPEGAGPNPTLRQIEREAYNWQKAGVDTAEAAEAHLRDLRARRGRQGALLQVLGIRRAPSVSEKKYLDSWLEMGFGPEAVALAYDKTMLNAGALKWPYLNKILKSWHDKGLHTLAEIEAGDVPTSRQSRAPSERRQDRAAADRARSYREATAWMDDFLKEENDGV